MEQNLSRKEKRKRREKRIRQRKRKAVLEKKFFWSFLLSLIILGVIFYLVFYSSLFNIRDIKLVAPDHLELSIQEKVNKYWGHNLLFLDLKKIENNILDYSEEIKEVKFERKYPARLLVQVEIREPVAVLCFQKGVNPENNCEGNYFLNEKGFIFNTPKKAKDSLFQIRVEGGFERRGEGQLFSEEEMNKLLRVANDFKIMNIPLEYLLLKDKKQLEAEIENDWKIFFDFSSDIRIALTKLDFLLQQKISLEERDNLEYIDLRFSKSYYKFD